MEPKKISFGFSKVAKKTNIFPGKAAIVAAKEEVKKVELIECLEGKEIKLVDGDKQAVGPLVIQMATNQKTSTALASLMKRRAVLLGEDEKPEELEPQPVAITEVTLDDSENLEKRATRELLASIQPNNTEGLEADKLVLPAPKADELPLDGAKEATLDDYESIPIQQFGLAMLRGMGWVDPPPKKKGQGPIADDAPFLRPKGMGLGADKAIKPKALLVQPEKNEVLEIKKQAFVRIMGGKLKDQYGQVEGFDDHAGRVIVKMAIGGTKEAFNEFLCQPVSRKEYSQYGKCINTAKYEEFKKLENKHGQIIDKREKSTDRDKKSYKEENRDSKPYRMEEQRQRLNREDERRRYKEEDRKSYRTDKMHKEEDRTERRKDFTDSRGSSSSTSTSTYRANKEDRSEKRRDIQDKRTLREDDREAKSLQQKQRSSDDEADDTGESTESDSDSAYERRKHKSSSKSKKKKSKKGKGKSRRKSSSIDTDESSGEYRRHSSKHKKKTKKSKHARSRSRSRSRPRVGRDR